MKTLEFIAKKHHLDLKAPSPIEIPNMGRNNLPELFAELGFKVGLEMGAEAGRYAEVLCKGNPEGKLYCVDAWETYPGYREHVSQSQLGEIYESAKKRLSPFNCELIKAFSIDAVKNFTDGSLDYVYIDGNHEYGFTIQDLNIWSKKVRPGGIIAGHDYTRPTGHSLDKCEVVQAVKDFTKTHNISPWFVIGSNEKIPGQIRDHSRSYMWVIAESKN